MWRMYSIFEESLKYASRLDVENEVRKYGLAGFAMFVDVDVVTIAEEESSRRAGRFGRGESTTLIW